MTTILIFMWNSLLFFENARFCDDVSNVEISKVIQIEFHSLFSSHFLLHLRVSFSI